MIVLNKPQPWWLDSRKTVSGEPGAVHFGYWVTAVFPIINLAPFLSIGSPAPPIDEGDGELRCQNGRAKLQANLWTDSPASCEKVHPYSNDRGQALQGVASPASRWCCPLCHLLGNNPAAAERDIGLRC